MKQSLIIQNTSRYTRFALRALPRALTVLISMTAALLASSPLLSSAQAQVVCGSVLLTDTTLTSNLSCPHTALMIGADNISIDLNGYTVSGVGNPGSAGIFNAGHRNITIKDGTISGFFYGIYFSGAVDNSIHSIKVEQNAFSGIFLENASNGNKIVECVVTNNGSDLFRGNGITINSSDGNLVMLTHAAANVTQGIFVGGGANSPASSNTRIVSNVSENNVSNGIGIIGGFGHFVANSLSRNNGGNGVSFSLNPVPGSVVESFVVNNEMNGNVLNGIGLTDAHRNTISGNDVRANVLNGIVLNNSDDNKITANHFEDNGSSGLAIRSGSDANAVDGNYSRSNSGRGVFVTTGGGLGPPQNNRFMGNRSTQNSLADIHDQTVGARTAGTDSTYKGNRCITAIPAGICVGDRGVFGNPLPSP